MGRLVYPLSPWRWVSEQMAATEQLRTRHVEKPWGRKQLAAPFDKTPGDTIGEIWFEPPTEADELLLKYIFTSQRLSVQVHPNDDQAMAAGLGRAGKEECWYVLDAEPGAKLAIGFKRSVSRDEVQRGAEDGSIMDLLAWHNVKPGDFFYIPANTVHAIGAGISIIEIQQNSDVTYRLYDYGRPRELHLDEALAIAEREPYDMSLHCQVGDVGNALLVDGPYFRLWRVDGSSNDDKPASSGKAFVLPYRGTATVGSERVEPGQCMFAQDAREICFSPGALGFLAQPL